MAPKTGFLADRAAAGFMTRPATIGIRIMLHITDQGFTLTAVRVMTGEAATQRNRIVAVGPVNLRFGMTGTANLRFRPAQQLVIVRLVGFMTRTALPLGIWLVGDLVFPG